MIRLSIITRMMYKLPMKTRIGATTRVEILLLS